MTAPAPESPSLVIFDCDGVLVDSERLIVDAEARIFAEWGLPIGRDEIIAQFVGTTAEDFRRRIDDIVGPDGYERWQTVYRTWFEEEFYRDLRPVDGIRQALATIDGPRCVASNSAPERVQRSLTVTGLTGFFGENVFTAADVARGKPAPDIFLHSARAMGVPPSRCVVVEDSSFGVRAARAAGMRVLAYAGGITSAQQLAGPHTTVFTRMRALPGLVERTLRRG